MELEYKKEKSKKGVALDGSGHDWVLYEDTNGTNGVFP